MALASPFGRRPQWLPLKRRKLVARCDRLTQNNVQFDQIQPESPTLENVFTTLLRQKGSLPKSLPFPRLKSLAFSELAKAKIAISARNLNRVFGSFHALVDLNLDIRDGDI